MVNDTMYLAGLVLLLATGLVTWAWLAMAGLEEELRSFGNFEGMHFDMSPPPADGVAMAKPRRRR
jgi:hypothetical protein